MNPEQISDIVSIIREDLAAMKESLKSAHKRIDENDALTAQIHKLATSINTLAVEVKNQNERMEKMIESFESRMKTQGERIGALEIKPGKKWDAVVEKVLMCVVTAIVAFLLARAGL